MRERSKWIHIVAGQCKGWKHKAGLNSISDVQDIVTLCVPWTAQDWLGWKHTKLQNILRGMTGTTGYTGK